MAITVTEPFAQSDSGWIERTIPGHADQSVSTADDFIVEFKITPAATTLVSGNFKVLNATDYSEIGFRDISLHNDYSDLTKILSLTLLEELEIETDYMFVISGIYDAAGQEMPRPHVVTFRTTDIATAIPEEIDEPDLIRSEDHTLIEYDIETSGTVTTADVFVERTSPTNLSYNVVETFDPVVLYFSETPTVITDIVVEQKLISEFETTWVDITSGSVLNIVGDTVEITPLPIGADIISPGYEYLITIPTTVEFENAVPETVYLSSAYTLQFCGILDPMFSSVANVLMNYPGFSSYDVAKMIYITTAAVLSINENIDPLAPPRTAVNYVTYMTLFRVGSTYGDANRIQLGDLEVEKPDDGILKTWLELALSAEAKLNRVKPGYQVKGENYTSPHSARDWDVDSGGTGNTRIGSY